MKFLNWIHELFFNQPLKPEIVVQSVYGMKTPDKRPVVNTNTKDFLLGSKKISLHAPTVLTADNPAYQKLLKENRAKQAV